MMVILKSNMIYAFALLAAYFINGSNQQDNDGMHDYSRGRNRRPYYGDQQHPAKSCAQIFKHLPNLPSGVYWLDVFDADKNRTIQERTYCQNTLSNETKTGLKLKGKKGAIGLENLSAGEPDKEPFDWEELTDENWPLPVTPPTEEEMKKRLQKAVKEYKEKLKNNGQSNTDSNIVSPQGNWASNPYGSKQAVNGIQKEFSSLVNSPSKTGDGSNVLMNNSFQGNYSVSYNGNQNATYIGDTGSALYHSNINASTPVNASYQQYNGFGSNQTAVESTMNLLIDTSSTGITPYQYHQSLANDSSFNGDIHNDSYYKRNGSYAYYNSTSNGLAQNQLWEQGNEFGPSDADNNSFTGMMELNNRNQTTNVDTKNSIYYGYNAYNNSYYSGKNLYGYDNNTLVYLNDGNSIANPAGNEGVLTNDTRNDVIGGYYDADRYKQYNDNKMNSSFELANNASVAEPRYDAASNYTAIENKSNVSNSMITSQYQSDSIYADSNRAWNASSARGVEASYNLKGNQSEPFNNEGWIYSPYNSYSAPKSNDTAPSAFQSNANSSVASVSQGRSTYLPNLVGPSTANATYPAQPWNSSYSPYEYYNASSQDTEILGTIKPNNSNAGAQGSESLVTNLPNLVGPYTANASTPQQLWNSFYSPDNYKAPTGNSTTWEAEERSSGNNTEAPMSQQTFANLPNLVGPQTEISNVQERNDVSMQNESFATTLGQTAVNKSSAIDPTFAKKPVSVGNYTSPISSSSNQGESYNSFNLSKASQEASSSLSPYYSNDTGSGRTDSSISVNNGLFVSNSTVPDYTNYYSDRGYGHESAYNETSSNLQTATSTSPSYVGYSSYKENAYNPLNSSNYTSAYQASLIPSSANYTEMKTTSSNTPENASSFVPQDYGNPTKTPAKGNVSANYGDNTLEYSVYVAKDYSPKNLNESAHRNDSLEVPFYAGNPSKNSTDATRTGSNVTYPYYNVQSEINNEEVNGPFLNKTDVSQATKVLPSFQSKEIENMDTATSNMVVPTATTFIHTKEAQGQTTKGTKYFVNYSNETIGASRFVAKLSDVREQTVVYYDKTGENGLANASSLGNDTANAGDYALKREKIDASLRVGNLSQDEGGSRSIYNSPGMNYSPSSFLDLQNNSTGWTNTTQSEDDVENPENRTTGAFGTISKPVNLTITQGGKVHMFMVSWNKVIPSSTKRENMFLRINKTEPTEKSDGLPVIKGKVNVEKGSIGKALGRDGLFVRPGLNRGVIETVVLKDNFGTTKQRYENETSSGSAGRNLSSFSLRNLILTRKISAKGSRSGDKKTHISNATQTGRPKDTAIDSPNIVLTGEALNVKGKEMGDPVKKPNPDELEEGLWTQEAINYSRKANEDFKKQQEYVNKHGGEGALYDLIKERNKSGSQNAIHDQGRADETRQRMKDFYEQNEKIIARKVNEEPQIGPKGNELGRKIEKNDKGNENGKAASGGSSSNASTGMSAGAQTQTNTWSEVGSNVNVGSTVSSKTSDENDIQEDPDTIENEDGWNWNEDEEEEAEYDQPQSLGLWSESDTGVGVGVNIGASAGAGTGSDTSSETEAGLDIGPPSKWPGFGFSNGFGMGMGANAGSQSGSETMTETNVAINTDAGTSTQSESGSKSGSKPAASKTKYKWRKGPVKSPGLLNDKALYQDTAGNIVKQAGFGSPGVLMPALKESSRIKSEPLNTEKSFTVQPKLKLTNLTRPAVALHNAAGSISLKDSSPFKAQPQLGIEGNVNVDTKIHVSSSSQTQPGRKNKPKVRQGLRTQSHVDLEKGREHLNRKMEDHNNRLEWSTMNNPLRMMKMTDKTPMQLKLEALAHKTKMNSPSNRKRPQNQDQPGKEAPKNNAKIDPKKTEASVEIQYEGKNSKGVDINAGISLNDGDNFKNSKANSYFNKVKAQSPYRWYETYPYYIPSTAEINKRLDSIPYALYVPKMKIRARGGRRNL